MGRVDEARIDSLMEVRLQAALDSVGDGVILTDAQGLIDFLNPVAARLTGLRENEARHQDCDAVFRLLDEATHAAMESPVARVLRELQPVTLDHSVLLVAKDGGERPITVRAAPIQDKCGTVCGVVLVFLDKNDDRADSKAGKTSDVHFRSLFNNMLNGFAHCQMIFEGDRPCDFIYLDVNRAFESLTGLKNVVGRKVSEIIPGFREKDAALLGVYGRVATTGKPETFERYVEALSMWFSIAAYSPAQGHFVAVFDVITERKQAQERAESAARFPAENPSPVLRVAADGTLLYANAGARPLLATWACAIGQPVPAEWGKHVAEVLAGGSIREIEVDCGDRMFALALSPIASANYANIYGHDITDRKQAEEGLKRVMSDLERSNRELEQFAYVASHDLQEPLRMVASYTQLLAQRYQGQLDEKAKKYIDYAVDGAVRMQRLITDLLAYSRVKAPTGSAADVDSHAVLGEALRNLQSAIQESHALVTSDDLPTVRADVTQLAQVFQNLIANAIKFHAADAPCVHVSVEDLGLEWRFSVRDNGIGIEAQYAQRIFGIFQRLHTRQEYPGTGIGLAVCKRIVESHGGRIWVESELGKGSVFFFTVKK
jgi:PAS domain S-box-containing protein